MVKWKLTGRDPPPPSTTRPAKQGGSVSTIRNQRYHIHANLSFAILVAQVLLLISFQFSPGTVPCKILAILLHFFFLSAFAWMLVEGLHLYSMVIKVFGSEESKHLFYYGIGWGILGYAFDFTNAVKITVDLAIRNSGDENAAATDEHLEACRQRQLQLPICDVSSRARAHPRLLYGTGESIQTPAAFLPSVLRVFNTLVPSLWSTV
ncbi:hypothetical protein lerEdw1_019397 [Lerista edwardsae]|nr:hypothetical protein lerEdw1_019397 [Lerista edwardsae]